MKTHTFIALVDQSKGNVPFKVETIEVHENISEGEAWSRAFEATDSLGKAIYTMLSPEDWKFYLPKIQKEIDKALG